MTMVEILKSIGELPTDTIAVIQAITFMGMLMYVITMSLGLIISALEEMIGSNGWRRKKLKFLSDDDIIVLNDYLEKDLSCFEIGEIVKTAYQKEEALRRIRRGWWKKLWKKDKEQ